MKRNTRLFFLMLTIYSLFSSTTLRAQDDYKYEIGGMMGTSFYMGDANKTKLFKNLGMSGGIVFRYNMDLNWSMKSNLLMGHVSGDTRTSGNAFPLGQQIDFSRNFYELGTQIEYNFFSYSDKFEYLGTKRITPYVFTGLGITYASGSKSFLDANIPFGLGVKYKLRDRWNIGFEFSFRKLLGDSFDATSKDPDDLNLNDPYKIKSGFMKNTDWYSLTMLTVTWDFGARICPCLNID